MPKRCFVIMPFSGKKNSRKNAKYWTGFYNNFLKKTVQDLGFKCERSDAKPNNIVRTIVSDLFRADIVLAILTDFNPNVFYELGVRHSLAHGTIMAIEVGQNIPFDLSHFGVVYYDPKKRSAFKQELEKAINAVEKKLVSDNPVAEFLNSNEVGIVRIAADIKDAPLNTIGALSLAQSDVLIIGQNLYGLANDQMRDRIFATLQRKPVLRVSILLADSGSQPQVLALAEMIDSEIKEQFPQIDRTFKAWSEKWNNDNPGESDRLQIKRCKRVGTVSATLIDTATSAGIILIRPVLYHTHPNARPCYWLSRKDSPRVFEAYRTAFEQMWSHGDLFV